MTQDNLIARLRTTWDDLSLIGWGNDARNVEEAIERLSPPLDGEGVIQADIERAEKFRRGTGGRYDREVKNLASEFAAHRRAATISTPREDEVERVAAAIIVCNGDMVGGGVTQDEARRILASDDAGDAGMAFAARELAKAALATLTPREQRMEEAWQPIETAPKYEWVLLYTAKGHHLGFNGHAGWNIEGAYADDGNQPTHWRPLPEPPALSLQDKT